jgi:hypothetical protein
LRTEPERAQIGLRQRQLRAQFRGVGGGVIRRLRELHPDWTWQQLQDAGWAVIAESETLRKNVFTRMFDRYAKEAGKKSAKPRREDR